MKVIISAANKSAYKSANGDVVARLADNEIHVGDRSAKLLTISAEPGMRFTGRISISQNGSHLAAVIEDEDTGHSELRVYAVNPPNFLDISGNGTIRPMLRYNNPRGYRNLASAMCWIGGESGMKTRLVHYSSGRHTNEPAGAGVSGITVHECDGRRQEYELHLAIADSKDSERVSLAPFSHDCVILGDPSASDGFGRLTVYRCDSVTETWPATAAEATIKELHSVGIEQMDYIQGYGLGSGFVSIANPLSCVFVMSQRDVVMVQQDSDRLKIMSGHPLVRTAERVVGGCVDGRGELLAIACLLINAKKRHYLDISFVSQGGVFTLSEASPIVRALVQDPSSYLTIEASQFGDPYLNVMFCER